MEGAVIVSITHISRSGDLLVGGILHHSSTGISVLIVGAIVAVDLLTHGLS